MAFAGRQIGLTTLRGAELSDEINSVTPTRPGRLSLAKQSLNELLVKQPNKTLAVIGVSVPGMADESRRKYLLRILAGRTLTLEMPLRLPVLES
ncbi:MAG: hypothetical protein IPG58_20910 [Acidobacteria bacterium]|nr:hypothetical protein [Acidobacteriota bacterium]